MPIDFNTLKLTTDFLAVEPDATVAAVYALLPKDSRDALAFTYVVAPLGGGRFFAARWVEIEEVARRSGPGVVRGTKLTDLQSLPTPTGEPLPGGYPKLASRSFADLLRLLTPLQSVEKSVSTQAAREERDAHPARRVAVTDGGQLVGLLTVEVLSADALGNDPFKRGGATLSIGGDKPPADRGATPAADPAAGDTPDQPAAGGEKKADRVFNYWVAALDDEGNSAAITASTPLKVGLAYELKINLARARQDAIASIAPTEDLDDAEGAMAPERELYDITIVLESADLTLYGAKEQILTVWRGSYSKNTAAFTFEPKQEGAAAASAYFFVDGRCFQQTTFSLRVGGRAGDGALKVEQSRGKTIASAMKAAPASVDSAPVSLVLIKDPAGYRAILSGAGVTRAVLNLSEGQIAELVGTTRQKLLTGVVNLQANGEPIYQSEVTDIPQAVADPTLKMLADNGTLLYQRLFGGASGPDARAMGDLLKKISQERQLHIEIIAERFIFPWALLFDGDRNATPIDPKGFWGFKHVIEYMPEFTVATPVNFVPEIVVDGKLPMAFVCHTGIDQQLANLGYPPVIGPQADYLGTLDTVTVDKRTTRQEFYDLLRSPDAPPFIYLNCHAESKQLGEKGGAYSTAIELTDGVITLDDLDLEVDPGAGGMRSGPLLFLNACQSAELSPFLYAGLVPAMLQRGARGVIGTEVDTPSQFAAEFAREFITRFSKGGVTLGQLLLDLRVEYITKKRNMLGLLYALYSSGDLVVKRKA